jgi:hypothetical protein
MSLQHIRRTLAVPLALLAGLGASGLRAEQSWLLGVAAQIDEEKNESLLATANWGVAEATWLSFSAGQSRADETAADVEATTLEAAVDHRFGLVGVEFAAQLWGDPDSVESTDLSGTVYFQGDSFRVGLGLTQRDIDIVFTLTGPLGRTFERKAPVGAGGMALTFRYTFNERWQLFAAHSEFDYDRDLSLLPRIDRLNFLSTSALTLADSFIEDLTSVGAEWAGAKRIVSFDASRDTSAVDGTSLSSLNAAVLFPVGARFDLELNLGRSDSDLLGSNLYGGLLFLVYGGH